MAVLSMKMLFRPDFNNVSVEFAAMPSFLPLWTNELVSIWIREADV